MTTASANLVAAVVRGEVTRWPSAGPAEEAGFAAAAYSHGLQAVVARQLRKAGTIESWPAALRGGLQRAAIQSAAVQVILDAEVVRVLDSLASAGVGALLIKGGGLAHTHYAYPCLRPRTDTDLLIPETAVRTAGHVMTALGYERFNQISGEVVRYQAAFVRAGARGVRHFYDLHWRVSERQRFSSLPAFDECSREASGIPALGEHARTPGAVHAMLIACVHRVAHHDDGDEHLIWIYDIDRLARAMSDAERRDLVRQAREHGVAGVCARGLSLARHWFGAPVGDLIAQLTCPETAAADIFLGAPMRKVDVLLSDLKGLPDWRERIRLLGEHLFPPQAYMLEHYGVTHSLLLPACYLHRMLAGVGPWLRRPR